MLPDEVRKAVDAVRVALNDWTATYASEFCDEGTVEAARKRISERGTLAYICDALGAVDSIRAHLLAREAELTELRREMDDYNAIESALEDAVATSNKHRDRAERAEALLRECLTPGLNEISLCSRMRNRITAHLSENSREHEAASQGALVRPQVPAVDGS